MQKDTKNIIAVVVGLLVVCLCCTFACLSFSGLTYLISRSSPDTEPTPSSLPTLPPWGEDELYPPDEENDPEPEPTPFSSQPTQPSAWDTLSALENEIVPINDPVDLAERLKGVSNIPETVETSQDWQVGDSQTFWITDNDTNRNAQIRAKLAYTTDVVLFWVEDGVEYNSRELRSLADTFSDEIYPINRQFFGSELSPGVDNDPRLYVLYTRGVGSSVAGYFSSVDSIHPLANEFSNAHEMFVLSADNVSLGEEYVYGTMAHEFQHMIHFALDKNEETWVNEGFSELSALLNDYDPGGFEYLFISKPDMQLTTWETVGTGDSGAHYGASFLYMTYFLGRFGEDATKALVADPANGMESVGKVLTQLGERDPQGHLLSANGLFADWAVANYLEDDDAPLDIYRYPLYPYAPKASPTEYVDVCPQQDAWRSVNQYGTDYIAITCPGMHTLSFQGAHQVRLLPEKAYSGDYAFWSNQGDESDMTLTREFDLSQVSGDIYLTYRTWFDLEEDYDYLYLLASTDGKTWDMVKTPSGTAENPAGSNYGWGYNGKTDGWIEEKVDLSAYAGQKVSLRFEYITDAAVNGRGLLLDDVRLDALDYASDFESDEGGWQAEGFVRVSENLPQTFEVRLITYSGDEIRVEPVTLDEDQSASLELDLSAGDQAVLVVSGTAPFTTETAGYRFGVR